MRFIHFSSKGTLAKLKKWQQSLSSQSDVQSAVSQILAGVRRDGEKAVLELTEKFDGVRLSPKKIRVTAAEMEKGWSAISPTERSAIRHAKQAIREFHKKSLPKSWSEKNADGILIGEKFDPIRRAGLYVPGGQVPLVSTVLMTAIPAQVAGVPEIIVSTPPQKDGSISNGLLAAFHTLGLKEVYRMGGAQAIAAMVYGTSKIRPVDFVAGPGNAFVMEAKRQVYGHAGIDLLPGPSEVMIIADEGADPGCLAADLIAQAEHGTGKEKTYLTVPSKDLFDNVSRAIEEQLPDRKHQVAIRSVLKDRTMVVVCQSLDDAVACANVLAPEHLELQVAAGKLKDLTRSIYTAGAILEGYQTPTVLGDFIAGPSHTLPTDGTGRFSGGLQVTNFLRRTSRVRSNRKANLSVEKTVRAFAEMEKLDGHYHSLQRRCQ